MTTRIITTEDEDFENEIKLALSWADTALFAVSYANYHAFQRLQHSFNTFLRDNGKLRTIFDIDRLITDKKLIEEFATIPGDSECKIFQTKTKPPRGARQVSFHSKLYVFHDKEKYSAIIGSSNFTLGGIRNNIECNICLSGIKDKLFESIIEYFWRIWNDKCLFNVLDHSEILDDYQRLLDEANKRKKETDAFLKELKANIERKSTLIEEAKKQSVSTEIMYLLGLLSANSAIDFTKGQIEIRLFRSIANQGNEFEGFYYYPDITSYKISQEVAHNKDVEVISEKVSELLSFVDPMAELSTEHVRDYHFLIKIKSNPSSQLFKFLKSHNINVDDKNNTTPFIPEELFSTREQKLVTAFLRGYCDLKSRISLSDGIYKTVDGRKVASLLRLGISLTNRHPELIPKFKKLFKKIGLKKGVYYSDPKVRDRELLIRVDVRVAPVDLVGTHWRKIFLRDFKNYFVSDKTESRE